MDVRVYKTAKTPISQIQFGEKTLQWETPVGWAEQPASNMRLSSFVVEGTDLDISITSLGADAADVASNVNRWRGQLGLEEWSTQAVLKDVQRDSSLMGEFLWFEIESDTTDKSILAAMFKRKNKTIFVKAIGSSKDIKAHKAKFIAFCKSIGEGA